MEPNLCPNGHDKNIVGIFKRSHRPSYGCRACKRNVNTNGNRERKGTKYPVRVCYDCNRSVVVFSTGMARHLDNKNEVCAGTGRYY